MPGLEIGVAEYEEGPTGCTIFHFPAGAAAATDVRAARRGRSAATSGARDGPRRGLPVRARGRVRRGRRVARPARLRTAVYPDKEFGRAALRAAREGRFPLGPRGAAFRQVGATAVAVFTVVNAVGAIVDRDGRVVRGHLDRATGSRAPLVQGLEDRLAAGLPSRALPPTSTTLTVVVTNQALDARALRQLGPQVHASLARAIHPFHALVDGDVLYAVTTGAVDNPALDPIGLALIASELAWGAVLAC